MFFRQIFARFVLLTPLIFLPLTLPAEDEIVIGVEDIQYLPHYNTDKGDFSGFGRDLFDAFAADNNLKVIYRPMSITRLYKALIENRIDLKYPDNANWKRSIKQDVEIKYSEPVIAYIDGVMVKSTGGEVKRLGTISGFTPWAWRDQIEQKKIAIFENPSFSGLLQQVLQGRIDGAYINIDVANYSLRELLKREGDLQFDRSLPHDKGKYFASTSRNPALIVRFNQWMKEHKQEIDLIKQRWLVQ